MQSWCLWKPAAFLPSCLDLDRRELVAMRWRSGGSRSWISWPSIPQPDSSGTRVPVQNDAVPRDGWEMAALAIGLGVRSVSLLDADAVADDGPWPLGFAAYRLYLQRNKSENACRPHCRSTKAAISPATRLATACPTLTMSCGALKERWKHRTARNADAPLRYRLESRAAQGARKARAEMPNSREVASSPWNV